MNYNNSFENDDSDSDDNFDDSYKTNILNAPIISKKKASGNFQENNSITFILKKQTNEYDPATNAKIVNADCVNNCIF